MFCIECGKNNNPQDYFCKNCGAEIKSKTKSKKIRKGLSLPNYRIGIISLIAFSIVILIILGMSVKNDQDSNSSLPVFSAVTLEVASKFYCPCGNCGKSSLDTCICDKTNGGLETKRKIELELSKGKQQLQVIKEFQIKHKSIKPEFLHLIK